MCAAVWIHNLGDALSNVAIVVGSTRDPLDRRSDGWTRSSALRIGGMVLWSGIGILRESSHILLEGLPRNIQLWRLWRAHYCESKASRKFTTSTSGRSAPTSTRSPATYCIPDMHMEESEKVLTKVREVLASEFQISHTTIQFERAGLPAHAGLYMPEPLQRSED